MSTRSGLRLAVVLSAIVTTRAEQASGQAEVRDPSRPILVLNPGGHGAPVQALTFAKGGAQLLSGGMDKVVHIWNVVGESPSLGGTIRPPIWRGPRGVIYALALSPEADEKGRQVLAVGGYGVQSQNGNIALYRVPGADIGGTGDLLAQLPCGNKADAEPVGHWDTVKCLAFDPGGQFLASGSFDGTVRIWDLRSHETVAVLKGHAGKPVRALAFGRDGTRLATAGGDGDVVLWDTDPVKLREFDDQRRAARDPAARVALAESFHRRATLFRAKPRPQDSRPDDPRGVSINALAFSPDGRWIVIGRENGRLARYDGANLGDERRLSTADRQGAVEALAFAPDSMTLAVSLLAGRLTARAERPGVACDVELRRMPDGDVVGPPIPRVSNLIPALAFSPDGKTLAYAGGDDQAVFLKDLHDANKAPVALAGLGGSLWDVGFSRDGRAVAYSRRRDDAPNPHAPATFAGFDLRGRRVVELARADVVRAVRKVGDLTLRPTGIDSLEVVDGRGGARPLALAPTDGRWWDYSLVPPAADHPTLAVAVAAEAGVVIFAATPDGKTFRRVRLLAGHAGPVYALAPSPDGKWLVSGSSDQTLRLWPLAHRDALAPFGATFAPAADGRMTATAVEPLGFASAMGLERGDVVEKLFLAGIARDPKQAATAPDAAPPEARLEFVVRRAGKAVELGTTKRDGPALTFFPSKDREWVFWMPQGYYDTSIVGDRKFLGWHRNGAKKGGGGIDIEASTDYFAIDKYEGELRRPAVLDALIASADPAVAVALVPAALRDASGFVADQAPPKVEVIEPALPTDGRLVVRSAALAVRARARTDDRPGGRRALGAVQFLVDGQPQREINPQKPDFDAPADLVLTPGLHHVTVVAVDDSGREGTRTFSVAYLPPDDLPPTPGPEPRASRLVALTLGAEDFSPGSGMPSIPFAANDARDVAAFFRDPRVQHFGKAAEARVVASPTSSKIQRAFAHLGTERKADRWGPGDTLIVMVESHVLVCETRSLVLGTDAGGGDPPQNALPACELSDALGEIARYGVRVVVLIDGVHEHSEGSGRTDSRVGEWVRELYRKNVIAFPASIQGPSRRLASRSHGAFAEAILGSLDARSRVRLMATSGRPMDLDEFRDAVEQGVQRLTGLQQFARCYVPPTIPARGTIFEPPSLPTVLGSRP